MSSKLDVVLTCAAHIFRAASKGVSFIRDIANEWYAAKDEVAQIRDLDTAKCELPRYTHHRGEE